MSAPNLNVPLECGAGIPPASVLSFTWPSYDHTILRLVLINFQQWRSYLTESTWRPTRERRSATFPQAVFFSRTPEAVLSTLVPFGQCSCFLSCILSYTGTMTAMVILLLVLCWVCSFVRSSRFQKGHCFIKYPHGTLLSNITTTPNVVFVGRLCTIRKWCQCWLWAFVSCLIVEVPLQFFFFWEVSSFLSFLDMEIQFCNTDRSGITIRFVSTRVSL